jgi:hypothetical protein
MRIISLLPIIAQASSMVVLGYPAALVGSVCKASLFKVEEVHQSLCHGRMWAPVHLNIVGHEVE